MELPRVFERREDVIRVLTFWILANACMLALGIPVASAKPHRCSGLESQLRMIEYAARNFHLDTDTVPKDASALVDAKQLDSYDDAMDPWGMLVVIELESDGDLGAVSLGPDQLLGTPDDYRTRDRLNCPPFPRDWGALIPVGVAILVLGTAGATVRHLLRHPG